MGMKVKHKRCISVIFAARVYPVWLFVFGETKRPVVTGPFVVPQLALRQNSIDMWRYTLNGFFGENRNVQGAAKPCLFRDSIISNVTKIVNRKLNIGPNRG